MTHTPNKLASRLFELQHIVKLAAFACESRRILTEIDAAAGYLPTLEEQLSVHTSGRNQWALHDDAAPQVLEYVAQQLELLAEDVGE
ncbi:hypothetical protein [Rhodoferax sp.]|uniref:hypothetical protein n=1 Tax=Rhodoferax sp. TaxID=50421 RepID=UPI00374D0E92